MQKQKGKIITITSSKGGVGKTTLLLNLAGIYQILKKKVLILDFDLSNGAIALNLNLEPQKTIYHIADDYRYHRFQTYHDYMISYNDYIDVVSAPKDGRQAMKIDIQDVTPFLEEVVYHYDVILIDTTHGFTKNNILTLDLSDQILYVLTNDFMDIKNTKNFMAIMQSAELKNIKVVYNEARDPELDYFSYFDMKSIMKHNIDYTISSSFHIKNITRYILEGKIFTLEHHFTYKDKKDYNKMLHMAEDLLKEE